MTMTLREFINDFANKHVVQSMENINSGIIIANLNDVDYLIRLSEVKE